MLLFPASIYRDYVFSIKAYFDGVNGPSLAQEFLFCFYFTLQKSKERCQRSWNKK
jgi:hypothetical protein